VALKTLIVLHRALREVDPTFREELITYTKTRGFMLNLSHFKDDSSPSGTGIFTMLLEIELVTSLAWDYSSWVRTYALYLEERLECFRVLKYDTETECSFFEMPRHDAVRAIEIYKKTGMCFQELDDFNHSAEEMEEKNSLALAIAADVNPLKSTSDETSGTFGWELALVSTPNSNENSVAQSKLVELSILLGAGGLDRLTLDSLYDDAFARTMNPGGGGGYHTGQVAPNPFDTSHYSQDAFYAFNSIAPPDGVEMATMAQQQVLMQQQQQALGQDGSNPFGNPFGPTEVSYAQDPSYNPYTGYM
ncbi:hypothetical protein BHE74_00011013, partial [Ensete ventricosum]